MPQCKKKSTHSKSSGRKSWTTWRYKKEKNGSETSKNEERQKKIELTVIHPINVLLADAHVYKTNLLHHCSMRYSGKKVAHTAKLTKRMKTITKPHEFKDSDLVTIFSFLGHFQQVCDSKVSEEVAMLLLPFSMTNQPRRLFIHPTTMKMKTNRF